MGCQGVEVINRTLHRRREVLGDYNVVERAGSQLLCEPLLERCSLLYEIRPDRKYCFIERSLPPKAVIAAVDAREKTAGDRVLKLFVSHPPDVRPIIEELGQCMAEIRVLRTCLELDEEKFTALRQAS